jgi:hypothetical protein
MQKESPIRALERETKAAELLCEQLKALGEQDEELIRDTIEGQTNLREILADMAQADGEDDALVDGLAAYIKKMQDRKARIEHRSDIRRSLMAVAMEVAELPKLETAAGTISRKAVAPKVVVVEEADLPPQFFAPQPPKLDKTALTRALKERATMIAEIKAKPGSDDYRAAIEAINKSNPEIPGAVLSNGGNTIQIRK